MIKLLLPFTFALGLISLHAQEEKKPKSLGSFSISSIGYANFANDEQHSSFIMDWKINEKNALMLRGYYDTNAMGDVFKPQLLFRKPIIGKLSILTGAEMIMERNIVGGANSTMNFSAMNGLSYEVQENLLIELMSETIIGKQNFNNNYNSSLIKLGTTLKF
ncbi:hypothetical protein [Cellulophaga baltica]|uniref:hypothetical protein n=1 Tax=Cellulophaga baltica TaxID=76594 RepID=UPI000406D9DD|nr:hypothetical protein [Cellulophaga baltica]